MVVSRVLKVSEDSDVLLQDAAASQIAAFMISSRLTAAKVRRDVASAREAMLDKVYFLF